MRVQSAASQTDLDRRKSPLHRPETADTMNHHFSRSSNGARAPGC